MNRYQNETAQNVTAQPDTPKDLGQIVGLTSTFTAAQVAKQYHCSPRKIRETAQRIGVGIDLGGRAGYRYTAADVAAIHQALKPAPTPAPRRRRRRAA